MYYTSDMFQGQIYIPFVNYTCQLLPTKLYTLNHLPDIIFNYIVMFACVAMVAAFKDASALTNAFG